MSTGSCYIITAMTRLIKGIGKKHLAGTVLTNSVQIKGRVLTEIRTNSKHCCTRAVHFCDESPFTDAPQQAQDRPLYRPH